MLTITGPAPWWGTADPSARNGALRPRSAAFGRFARAVAERYGDRVDTYMIWNEPNQPGWLMPQNTCTRTGRRKTCTPTAPGLYRPLVRAAVPQIRRADPRATILMGELAPIGQNPKAARSPIKPLTFLRELACVDAHYRKRTTGDCARFKAPAADGIGYHPHGRRQPPDVANRDVNEAQLADLSRLLRVLDRLSASRRLLAPARTGRKFDVYLTEFGFQTFPPDPGIGVTLDQQVRYIQQAAYIAWSTRRVRNLTHYQWEDERLIARGNSRYGGWQSGLRFVDGRPKPALGAFEAPFVADTDRGRMWGQIRPGAGPYAVTLWRRAPGQADFAPLNAVPTDRNGYWTAPIGFVPGTAYRFTWTDPTTGTVRVSGDLTLSITGRGLQTAGPAPPQPPLPLPVAVAALPAPDATPTPTAGPAPAPAPAS
jgi:hypothetical protein